MVSRFMKAANPYIELTLITLISSKDVAGVYF